MTLAVLGATGFTGRLVVAEARRAGIPLRLVGRRREALEALAGAEEEVRVADARDVVGLGLALEGCDVIASCAGPFMPIGLAPVLASIGAGAHYLDTSGEQAWVHRLHTVQLETETALIPAFGFDYVPGDLAARLAAEQVEGLLDEVAVGYSVKGVGTSRGTRRTIATVMGQKQVTYLDGRLVPSRFGARTRKMRFPFGERTVVEWSGTEPLTVPRHTEVRNVHSFIRAPAAASLGGRLGPLVAPFLRPLSRIGPSGPSEESRRESRFAVVAEARGSGGTGRAVLTGSDVYGLTALLIVRGTQALLAGEARGVGVLAAAEAFDARSLAERLAPLLEVVEPA